MRAASRRAFLASLPFLSRAADVLPSESKKVRDPATEFELTRLTDPSYNSWLIRPPLRSVGGRSNSLIYCSDRTGSDQVFRLDLKSGDSRQLTSAAQLDQSTVGWLPDERTVCCFDGDRLVTISGSRTRPLYQVENGWTRTPAFVITDDGNHALFAEKQADRHRMRMVTLGRGAVSTLVESDQPITLIRPRPK